MATEPGAFQAARDALVERKLAVPWASIEEMGLEAAREIETLMVELTVLFDLRPAQAERTDC